MRFLIAALFALTCGLASAHADPLAETLRVMAAAPVVAGRIDVALHTETEGHVTLANRGGERFTASLDSKSGELQRGLATLAPESKTGSAITIHLSRAVLHSPSSLLVVGALIDIAGKRDSVHFMAVVAGRSYPATLPPASTDPRQVPTIELAPGWHVGVWQPELLEQALWTLTRPVKRSDLRIIALTPGAPRVLSSTPRMDLDSRVAQVDPIDPSAAADVVASARNQVLVFSGAVAAWGDLRKAARGNDVTLIHIDTASATQPGGRNFLWLPVRTPLMSARAEQVTLLDVLALSAGKRTGKILLSNEADRLQMEVILGPTSGVSPTLGRWLDKVIEVAGDVSGSVQARGINVSVPTVARQIELDRRIIKAVPSVLQYSYAALLLLGLIGLPTAWRWFARIWPQEAASDYAHAAGFHAARAVRAALFAIVFMPLAAIVAAPAHLFSLITRRPA